MKNMQAYKGFEERKASTDAAIRSGTVGCRFANYFADEIMYAGPKASQLDADVRRTLHEFRESNESSVLYLLPELQPQTHAQGEKETWKLYSAVMRGLHSMRPMTWESYEDALRDKEPYNMHSPLLTKSKLEKLLKNRMYREYITRYNIDMLCGVVPAMAFKSHDGSWREDRLFTFTMAPYYKPMTDLAHPRYAPHSGMFIGYERDLFATLRQPEQLQSVRDWSDAAVGYKYKHSLHLTDPPLAADADDSRYWKWAQEQARTQSSVGLLRKEFLLKLAALIVNDADPEP